MPDISPMNIQEYVLAIARHEAAHWIVGWRLGASMGAITMRLDHEPGTDSLRPDCHATGDRLESIKTVPEIAGHLRRRVRALMAGAIAQLPTNAPATIPEAMRIWKNEGQDDYAKIREFCQLLRNIQYGEVDRKTALDQLNEISSALFQASVVDVQEAKAAIMELAARMTSAVKEFNRSYVFSTEEICSLASVKALFPSP